MGEKESPPSTGSPFLGDDRVFLTTPAGSVVKAWEGDRGEVGGAKVWLPEKILQFRRAVGLSVEKCPGGCNDVMEFAKSREKQNQEELLGSTPKRRGARELQNLSTTVNYEKGKEGTQIGCQQGYSARRGGRKGKGILSSGQ